MRSFEPRTSMGAPYATLLAKEYVPVDGGPRMQMGDEVPTVIREDAEFRRLFRESQKIKGSRRPADQEKLRTLLNEMRARWALLTGESDAN
jgi:hypothetical protein